MRTRVIALLTAVLLISAAPASAAENVSTAVDAKGDVPAVSVETYDEIYSSFNGTTGGGGEKGFVSPLAAGTWQYDIYVNFRNIDQYLWKYQHRIFWTGTGTSISGYTPSDFSTYQTWFWQFTDTTDEDTSTYWSGGIQYKQKQTNGRYQYVIGGVTLKECNPYAESKVGGNSFHSTIAASIGGC